MDFSSLNPNTSNPLNIAARRNDFQTVHRLLKKVNPNCVDNRGWTCLHEAAANDSYQSLVLILKHLECRPLAETHEGHTALYLACRHYSSMQTIKALADSAEDIVNYGSTEGVTPLHVASSQGRVEVMQLLIDCGALIDVQDFDGDTPLHDAALGMKLKSVSLLLHAGADLGIKNETSFTAFHLACFKGGFHIVEAMLPFIDDINHTTHEGDTPLILASQVNNVTLVQFLLDNGADPHIKNVQGLMAIDVALNYCEDIFNILLGVTDKDKMVKNVIQLACKPHYYKYKILEGLLNQDLGPDFFDFHEPFHVTLESIAGYQPEYSCNAPLNSYLNICEYIYNSGVESFRKFLYLFLMNGVSVNALLREECPPLVYIHYSGHSACFEEVFKIFIEHNCNVDYSSLTINNHAWPSLPDAFIASVTSDPATLLVMLPYSLHCEPDYLLSILHRFGKLSRIPVHVQKQLLSSIDNTTDTLKADTLSLYVPPLKHLCRLKVRSVLRSTGIKTTHKFLETLEKLPIPPLLKYYLRYL